MREDIMPGEVVLSRACQGGNLMPSEKMDDPARKLQEMAEKLEKSEAGRKKLRQAIAMLKEKMEATEKVLQVNETLRQECEKERLRAETESKKAEEEKALRVQIEGENRSVKEELVGVLQRLHAVERNAKSDRAETLKLRGEMKQSLSALGGALQVAEAAQSSLEGLEKLVEDKVDKLLQLQLKLQLKQVNTAVSSSTRASSMAQSVTSDVETAQGVAASAEKISQSLLSRLATVQKQSAGLDQRVTLLQQETSKALSLARSVSSDARGAQVAASSAEKTSQSLLSRIAAVQKQSAGLDQRVNILQQELRTRIVDGGATPSGARTANGAVPCVNKKVSNKGMVLSKSQQPIVSSVNNLRPPYRSSVVGSSDLMRDIVRKETSAGLSGLCVPPKGHHEAIPLVDSGSSADCVSTVSRELDLSSTNKVSNSTRGTSIGSVTIGSVTNRKLTASSPVSTAAPCVPKPADAPCKCAPYHKDVQITSEPANEAMGRANVDSCRGSFPAFEELCEKHLSYTNISIPHISSVTRRKVSSKKCLATGPINSDFCDRQRVCGAVNTAEDKAQPLPLRVTDAEKGMKDLDVGEDNVLKGQRKVKLPAALLKDITKLFNKEKKVQVRMEAKLMALEQVLQSGGGIGTTIAEQLSDQVTGKRGKRKRREKMSDRKSKEDINEDCHQKSRKKSRIDAASQPGVGQAVEDCSGSLGKRASRNGSKDPVTGDPTTPVQSTPPFALPQVSESVVADISGTAKLPEQPGKEVTEYASMAVSSVSDPNDGERCNGLRTQIRNGLENGEENISEAVNCCRDIPGDNVEMYEWSGACSSELPERARTSGNDREDTRDMDIDRSIHKPVLEIPEGTGHGWATQSESSDDDFDPEWWTTERVLLSPTLPKLQRSTHPQSTPVDSGVTGPKEMSIEDLAFFLDVLPPISGEGCEEEIKDVDLQHLSGTQTLDESFSDNIRCIVSICPKFQNVEKLDEVKATQVQDNWSNTGGPRICRSPLSSSFARSSLRDMQITREDPRKEDDTRKISTNFFEVKVVSDDKLGNTGVLKVLGQSQTSIVTSAVDGGEADGSLGKEDEQIMVRDSVAGRGLVLVNGVERTDKAQPMHEASALPTPRSPANIQKSLNCESRDEAGVQEEFLALIPTVENKPENPGVDGSVGKEARENMVRDSVASRCTKQVTVTQPSSNLAVPPPGSIIVLTASTPTKSERSLNCHSGEEGREVQETESTSKIEDVYPEPNCEGEAKSNPPYGLNLLAGFLGENKALDFPDLNTHSIQQIPWRIREIASVVGRTRDCLVHALKHHSTYEVKSWTASNDLASSLEKTRLSGMDLLSIFTASLIDAYAWWESEISARAPPQSRLIQFLFLLVSEVFKAELFRRVLSPDFQIVDIFADQLQEFLIKGSVRPVLLPEVENTSCDDGAEITFQIPSATSDMKRTRIVTSASNLLASFCLRAGKTDHLRKSMYLMLRYSNMDSSWLLAANSSFATVCGRQLFSAGAGDIAGQAVRVVISELLNDAEGTHAPGNGTFVTDSPAGNVDESREEAHGQTSDAVIGIGEVIDYKISSTNFRVLRESVGKFENGLNFEAVLPKFLQLFLNVISSKELLDSPYIFPGSGYQELHERTGRPFCASRVREWAASTEGGASLQQCQKFDLEEIDACCWLCGCSTSKSFRSTSVNTMDPGTRSGDPCIAWGQKFHGVTHALELIACHLGWEWTYNDLIVEHLWKCMYPGAPDNTVACVARSIGIFGRLGIEADGTELQGVEELRRILTAILRSVARVDEGTCAFSFTAQVAAAQSLINLSRDVKKDTWSTTGPISDSQASLLAWLQALDPTIRESLPLSLRNLVQLWSVDVSLSTEACSLYG